MQLAVEIGAVALATAVLFYVVDWLFQRAGWRRVPAWALAGLVGGLAHLALDVTGANAWYCANGAACLKK